MKSLDSQIPRISSLPNFVISANFVIFVTKIDLLLKERHRTGAKITADTVDKIFADAGVDNGAFDRGNGSSNTDDEASSTTRASGRSNRHDVVPGTQIRWKDRGAHLLSSDQLSSSTTSKM